MSEEFLSSVEVELEQSRFITKVYAWMASALFITALVSFFVYSSYELLYFILSNKIIYMGLILGELMLVGYLVVAVKKMSATTAALVFLGYSMLNGVTMAVVFLVYTTASIASTFLITALTFGIMSAYGYFTKRDMTTIGNLLFMALIGVLLSSVVNLFIHSETIYWISTYVGVFVFVGLTAYDTQKIKQMNIIGNDGTAEDKKEAIVGALTLYLDFINLFLMLLRIFGKKR